MANYTATNSNNLLSGAQKSGIQGSNLASTGRQSQLMPGSISIAQKPPLNTFPQSPSVPQITCKVPLKPSLSFSSPKINQKQSLPATQPSSFPSISKSMNTSSSSPSSFSRSPPFGFHQTQASSHLSHLLQLTPSTTLPGLPFSKEALPHAYFKVSFAVNTRNNKEDPVTLADEDGLTNSISSSPLQSTTGGTQFVVPPTIQPSPLQQSASWYALDFSGIGLRQLAKTSPLFGIGYGFSSLISTLTGLYLTANLLREIPPEIGLLKNLTVLHLGYNRLLSLTPAIGMCTQLKELQLQENELASLPPTIGNLHRLVSLNLEGNPWSDPLLLSALSNIGNISASSATPGSSTSSLLAARTASLVIPFIRDNVSISVVPPSPRKWEVFGNKSMSSSPSSPPPGLHSSILVLSWNILAEIYADPPRYGYTPSWALSWPYRQEAISQILRASAADFIVLQEVEVSVFYYFLDELRMDPGHLFDGIFLPKHRYRTLSASSDVKSSPVDGVAIFWRSERFLLNMVSPIEFCSHSLLSEKSVTSTTLQASVSLEHIPILDHGPPLLVSSSDLFNRAMLKDNVALLARFKRVNSTESIIIGSVHLQWDEAFKDVKMLQASILSQKLLQFASVSDFPAIILAGDFNAIVGSGTHSIFSEGVISGSHPDWMGYSYPPFTNAPTRKGVPLKSAYHFDLGPGVTDERISTLTDTFSGLIDYIWYSEESLQVIGRLALPLPNDPSLEGIVGLPNVHYPSDHLPLMSEFVQLGRAQEDVKPSGSSKNFTRTSR